MKQIPLTRGKMALVDDDDYNFLSQMKWHCDTKGYARHAVRFSKTELITLRMHRVITKAAKGVEVDHIDGNKLNNQKSNLRFATDCENKRNQKIYRNNTSGIKGVSWHKGHNRWTAHIGVNGRKIWLGHFRDREDAAKCYREAAIRYHGNFTNPKAFRTNPSQFKPQ